MNQETFFDYYGVVMREIDARVLADRGGVYSASVKACVDGYILRFETAKGLEALTLQRGGDRVFKTLDAIAALLRSMSVASVSLDLAFSDTCNMREQFDQAKQAGVTDQVVNDVTHSKGKAGATARAGGAPLGGACAAVAPSSSRSNGELLLDAGMHPLEKAKADPKRAKARANRKKRR